MNEITKTLIYAIEKMRSNFKNYGFYQKLDHIWTENIWKCNKFVAQLISKMSGIWLVNDRNQTIRAETYYNLSGVASEYFQHTSSNPLEIDFGLLSIKNSDNSYHVGVIYKLDGKSFIAHARQDGAVIELLECVIKRAQNENRSIKVLIGTNKFNDEFNKFYNSLDKSELDTSLISYLSHDEIVPTFSEKFKEMFKKTFTIDILTNMLGSHLGGSLGFNLAKLLKNSEKSNLGFFRFIWNVIKQAILTMSLDLMMQFVNCIISVYLEYVDCIPFCQILGFGLGVILIIFKANDPWAELAKLLAKVGINLLFGIIGNALIPIPFLGSFIGSFFGSFICSYLLF